MYMVNTGLGGTDALPAYGVVIVEGDMRVSALGFLHAPGAT